jgi:poly(3-hydroxybutyrate) depolymerase
VSGGRLAVYAGLDRGAGHGWPGSRSPLLERILGPDTAVLDAATEVWRFLARFRRPDAPPLR